MKRIVINLKDESKEEIFRNFLREIPFIEIEEKKSKNKESFEFKKLYGIWKNRDITLREIREKAWHK